MLLVPEARPDHCSFTVCSSPVREKEKFTLFWEQNDLRGAAILHCSKQQCSNNVLNEVQVEGTRYTAKLHNLYLSQKHQHMWTKCNHLHVTMMTKTKQIANLRIVTSTASQCSVMFVCMQKPSLQLTMPFDIGNTLYYTYFILINTYSSILIAELQTVSALILFPQFHSHTDAQVLA